MNRNIVIMGTLSLALGACVAEDEGTQLLVPTDVDFSWYDAYNEYDDGRAAVIPFDVMVYEGATGEPIPGAAIELVSDHALLLPSERVESAGPGCRACVWDAQRDAFVVVPSDAEGTLALVSDDEGYASVHAVIDSLPFDGLDFELARISVTVEDRNEVIRLLPR